MKTKMKGTGMNYFSLLKRVFQDVLADKTRIKISQQEVSACCDTLAQVLRQNYEPELIVAIDSGGSVPGELVAQILSIPILHLTIRRDINLPRRYGLDPIPLRWIMSIYHHFLFQTVEPTVFARSDIDVSGKKVLIIDDTIHTGATIDVAVNLLKHARVSEIKIASLTYVSERKPDFSVLPPGNYSFPWSRDYPNLKT